uniref:Reprolysin n=1 Tax=Rhipicephalus zambeziensis TaxID=60191 RepID=A0A224YEB3_9ACAR
MRTVFLLLSMVGNLRVFLAIKGHGIVYPTLLSARESGEQKTLKINERLTLNLQRSEVFSDDFVFISEENGENIHLPMRKYDYEKHLYHDENLLSSVVVREDDGVTVEGILNEKLSIKPLLEMARTEDGRVPHQLLEIPRLPQTPPHHRDYNAFNISASNTTFEPHIEERSSQSTIYPELHIVQDSAHAKIFGYKKTAVIVYFAVFINAVNLRYALNASPRIQLRIRVITMSSKVEEYLVHPGRNQDEILDEETLAKFNEYYAKRVEFTSTDLTFLVTGRDMTFYENGVLQKWVGGYAYVGGFCQKHRVGMCEDIPGSYFGVTVFSHEIGHSLGCVHDGSPAESVVPGHRGSSYCPWDDGFLMSYVRKNRNQYRFSSCCIADIKNVLSRPEWGCLHKRKKKSIKRPGLPGVYISGEDFCRNVYPDISGMHYDKRYGVVDCKVHCDYTANYYIIGVPDGVVCNKKRNKHCVLGECIDKRE